MNKDFLHYSLKFNDQLINKFEEVVIPRTDGQIPTHIRRQVPPAWIAPPSKCSNIGLPSLTDTAIG